MNVYLIVSWMRVVNSVQREASGDSVGGHVFFLQRSGGDRVELALKTNLLGLPAITAAKSTTATAASRSFYDWRNAQPTATPQQE